MSPGVLLAVSMTALCQNPPLVNQDILPPALPWDGASKALIAAADDPWITPCERDELWTSPSYDETVAWLQKLTAAAPELAMTRVGKSLQGRDIWMVIASAEREFTPAAWRARGKPVVLAHAGIHSGEIDGKDAGMMLLRDMTVKASKRALLQGANFLFIPILSVDGHERAAATNRINQRGPRRMGWRTNGRNLNLNRDYAKLETEGVRAVVDVINAWQPDMYLDLHVTDGIDYQYDITFGYNGPHAYSPAIAAWLDNVYTPTVNKALSDMGHIPGPLIFATDGNDLTKGLTEWTAPPRFSNGYGDLRHLPSVLVENHSLKPYPQRVLGTYVLLEASLRVAADTAPVLRAAMAKDRAARPESLVLAWQVPPKPQENMDFLGIAYERVTSAISGANYLRWLGKAERMTLPYQIMDQPAVRVKRPRGYFVPPTWPEVRAKLARHGIAMHTLEVEREEEVTFYRLVDPKLDAMPFEGRARVQAQLATETRRYTFEPGTVFISTDQVLGDLAMALLEPAGPDSFFQWGYFHEILQRTEYFEVYAAEPLAEAMLKADPALAEALAERKAADPEFAKNPRAILDWFYSRSPYIDAQWNLYPIARLE